VRGTGITSSGKKRGEKARHLTLERGNNGTRLVYGTDKVKRKNNGRCSDQLDGDRSTAKPSEQGEVISEKKKKATWLGTKKQQGNYPRGDRPEQKNISPQKQKKKEGGGEKPFLLRIGRKCKKGGKPGRGGTKRANPTVRGSKK